MPDTFNILMYSHDTYGLGHIRRTMAIARHLLDTDVNILILTGSPIVGRFAFPTGIDFVRIPGMIKQSNTIYTPHSIKVNPQHALDIRQEIITATAKAFDPSMFIVDKVPVGLKGEVRPILEWFRTSRPRTKVILGLRDILDDAKSTNEEWVQKNYFNVLDELYSEVWIYGNQSFYDPIKEYGFPDNIAEKCIFTGYIPRSIPTGKFNVKQLGGNGKPDTAKLVVVTAGGGGDGYQMLDCYLRMIEENGSVPFRSLLISGPFAPSAQQDELAARARKCGVAFSTFQKRMEKIIATADVIVSMGGYNTVCEILSLKKVSLIIPRESPRQEQLIRAKVLKKAGLADYLKWDMLEPAALRRKIDALLEAPQSYSEAIKDFPMTGLDVMRSRLSAFRKE
ncbi:glycosyltransferase [Desulfovibrio mangrovi]|uniref:glycosyltransferase family protein n=1 Tax=Desulfovibrio mangrovi TaxID=2976983 RepID=UPI0022483732|nr:glycosyltransferase [Desulfovibrio mangrovi]UZP66646.1 glycosyltransferase [Desulfovibrio mangrovi]